MSEQELQVEQIAKESNSEKTGPRHVGLILDGNRRFAKRLMLQPWKGHELGYEKVEKLFDWCKELDIKEITLYAFSVKNFNRPKKEFDYLMKIFQEGFEKVKNDERIKDIRINFLGRIYMFPEKVKKTMKELMEATKNNDKYVINFAMAYGGREEIIDSVKKIAEKVKNGELDVDEIDKESIGENMYMNSDVDLIIRTSGEKRTSDFLPWQGHYAEWFFLDKMWPEFEKQDLIDCINEFNSRNRRFGA